MTILQEPSRSDKGRAAARGHWLGLLACVATVLLCVAMLPDAALASRTPNWQQGRHVALTPDVTVTLDSLSCASAGNCSAVGSYTDGSGNEKGLLLTESSGTWGSGVEASLPGGTGANPTVFLRSVSCVSAGNCSAVGYYHDGSGDQQGLLLTESSGTWGTGVEASLPADADPHHSVSLYSVSCVSAGNCSAVGSYTDGSGSGQGLLLTESSGTWGTGVEASLPANAGSPYPNASLDSVSCVSVGNCSAVGSYADGSRYQHGLLLTESSGTWGSGVEPSLPAGASLHPNVILGSVSCVSVSAGNCSAVGTYNDSSGNTQGLLLTESSGTWGTGAEASLPAGASAHPYAYLGSVSCVSAGNCSAVGTYYDGSGNTQGLLVTESSGTWGTGVEAVPPAGAAANPTISLSSVSCVSAGNCSAVGSYIDSSGSGQGLLLTQSSGAWGTGVEASPPASAGPSSLDLVSCASAGDCTAVGGYQDSSGNQQGLLLTESSGTWGTGVQASLPAGAGSSPSVTAGVLSCASAGNCSAVGSYTDGSDNHQGLLLTESSGTLGSGLQASVPAGANPYPYVSVDSVSCVSAGKCSAAGYYIDGSYNEQGLLLTESSGTWGTGVKASVPSGAGSSPGVSLNSVSCASAGNCSAVGSYEDNSSTVQGLLLTESSGTWGIGVKARLPAGAGSSPGVSLSSVSCVSAGNCSAVGSYEDGSGNTQGLLVTESSGTWATGVKARLPSGAASSPYVALNSVSCVSAGKCSAVGSYEDGSGRTQGLLLTESSGTWGSGVKARLPAGAGSSPGVSLSSVSCVSAGNCSAVGSYEDGSGHTQGLLLTESSGTWATGVKAMLPTGAASNPVVSLVSVSCGSVGNCTAVGSYTDSSFSTQGLLLTGSSGSWGTGVKARLPADAGPNPNASLSSVSCPSAQNCGVLGTYVDNTGSGLAQALVLNAVPTKPALSLSAPENGRTGSAIRTSSLTATLSGGSAPTGSITFKVFGPRTSAPTSCAAGGTTVGHATVSGNRTYHPSAGFTPHGAGKYWWYASYGGDAGDNPGASRCGASMAKTTVRPAPRPARRHSSPRL